MVLQLESGRSAEMKREWSCFGITLFMAAFVMFPAFAGPLHDAIYARNFDTARRLIEARAEVNVMSSRHREKTPLHLALIWGHKALVELLIDHGADVKAQTPKKMTPLHQAALGPLSDLGFPESDEVAIAALLLDKGADVNARTSSGRTPLHFLSDVADDDIAMAQLLLGRGADVNATDRVGITSLHLAAQMGNLRLVKLFLKRGADPSAKDRKGRNPLLYGSHHEKVAMLLIDSGSAVDVKDRRGRTVLHYVAFDGLRDLAASLIAHGADVNARDSDGRTPLHHAARPGVGRSHGGSTTERKDVAMLLIMQNADVHVKDKDEKTPLQLAKDRELIELLRKAEK